LPYGASLLIFLTLVFAPSLSYAQQPVATPPATVPAQPALLDASGLFRVGDTEWMATLGSAWGVVVFHSAGGHQYLMQTVSWGRVLSGPKLSGPLRGRFEWAFEVTPVYGQYHPDNVFGFGVSPMLWRWNLEPRGKYVPFAQLAGGALWTTAPVPQGTTSANFTANAGAGVRILVRPQQAIVLMYRFDHISNGNRLERNPGVNAHALHFGWNLLRPRS
jgi:hypothetical protein